MQNQTSGKTAFSAGLFILLGLFILIFGVLWLRMISLKPSYTFDVLFRTPDHVSADSMVYYRGVEVGKVEAVNLSEDSQSTIVRIGIRKSRLRLPKNVRISLQLEGITGQRSVNIKPPEGPLASETVHPGDMLIGHEDHTWEKLEAKLNRLSENDTLEKMVSAGQNAMRNMASASKDIQVFVEKGQKSLDTATEAFSQTNRHIRSAADHIGSLASTVQGPLLRAIPQATEGIQTFNRNTRNLGETLFSVKTASDKIGDTISDIDAQLLQTDLIPKAAATTTRIYNGVNSINRFLEADHVNALTDLSERMDQLKQTAQAAQRSVILMNKRFPTIPASVALFLNQLSRLTEAIQTRFDRFEAAMAQANDETALKNALLAINNDAAAWTEDADALQRTYKTFTPADRNLKAPSAFISPPWEMIGNQLVDIHQSGEKVSALSATLIPRSREILSLKQNAGQAFSTTVKQFGCTARQLQHMLGQRFLAFKLLFGQPGKGYQCVNPR